MSCPVPGCTLGYLHDGECSKDPYYEDLMRLAGYVGELSNVINEKTYPDRDEILRLVWKIGEWGGME